MKVLSHPIHCCMGSGCSRTGASLAKWEGYLSRPRTFPFVVLPFSEGSYGCARFYFFVTRVTALLHYERYRETLEPQSREVVVYGLGMAHSVSVIASLLRLNLHLSDASSNNRWRYSSANRWYHYAELAVLNLSPWWIY